ncbi:MAG: hypothetical protein AAGA56_24795 [Myxococcota bacterium]
MRATRFRPVVLLGFALAACACASAAKPSAGLAPREADVPVADDVTTSAPSPNDPDEDSGGSDAPESPDSTCEERDASHEPSNDLEPTVVTRPLDFDTSDVYHVEGTLNGNDDVDRFYYTISRPGAATSLYQFVLDENGEVIDDLRVCVTQTCIATEPSVHSCPEETEADGDRRCCADGGFSRFRSFSCATANRSSLIEFEVSSSRDECIHYRLEYAMIEPQ